MSVDDLDVQLEQQVRATLNGVAAGVLDKPKSRRHVRRGVLAAVAAVALTSSAAFMVIRSGPEYVDELPIENALFAGQAHGTRYWLVPAFHKDVCGRPMPGVEILVESLNKRGQEWNTGGFSLESDTPSMRGDCRPQIAKPLPPPGEAQVGVQMRLGKDGSKNSDWAYVAAVHPTITAIRLTVDGTDRVLATVPRSDQPDGARYAIAALPPTTQSYSVVLLGADGRVVPCTNPERCGPRQLPPNQ